MTSPLPICSLSNPEHPLVDGAARVCHKCQAPLCLRKQVINLALGLTDEMMCLNCLASENGQDAREVLEGLQDYIQSRECFAKQWRRYETLEYCPDATGCVADVCFK
jgi:hypothetical protein